MVHVLYNRLDAGLVAALVGYRTAVSQHIKPLVSHPLQGTILAFVTEFFADFLATDSVDDLVALLKKARLDERLLEFFPPQQRTLEQFNAHFKVRSSRTKVRQCCSQCVLPHALDHCLPTAGLAAS